jgi:isocitrate/isopropylmalate dehydrogenase
MLEHLGHAHEAGAVVRATRATLGEDRVLTRDLGGSATTRELADAIARRVRQELA